VVKLVNDDHVEVFWIDVGQPSCMEALNGREDMLESMGPLAGDP
jgi:hypothetical protein